MLAALWAAVAVCAALLAVSALPDAASALALAAFCAVVAVCAALLAVPALPDAASALALATLAAFVAVCAALPAVPALPAAASALALAALCAAVAVLAASTAASPCFCHSASFFSLADSFSWRIFSASTLLLSAASIDSVFWSIRFSSFSSSDSAISAPSGVFMVSPTYRYP